MLESKSFHGFSLASEVAENKKPPRCCRELGTPKILGLEGAKRFKQLASSPGLNLKLKTLTSFKTLLNRSTCCRARCGFPRLLFCTPSRMVSIPEGPSSPESTGILVSTTMLKPPVPEFLLVLLSASFLNGSTAIMRKAALERSPAVRSDRVLLRAMFRKASLAKPSSP